MFAGERAGECFEVEITAGFFVCFGCRAFGGVFLRLDQVGAQHGESFRSGAGRFTLGRVVTGDAGLAERDGHHFLRCDHVLVCRAGVEFGDHGGAGNESAGGVAGVDRSDAERTGEWHEWLTGVVGIDGA